MEGKRQGNGSCRTSTSGFSKELMLVVKPKFVRNIIAIMYNSRGVGALSVWEGEIKLSDRKSVV